MATPRELLGQLAQQFEAAGNPQVAAQFRSMAGGAGPSQAMGHAAEVGLRGGAQWPVSWPDPRTGQMTDPRIGGRPSPAPLALPPGPAGPPAPVAAPRPTAAMGMQQSLFGPVSGAPQRAWAAPTGGGGAIPMHPTSGRRVQSMGSPEMSRTDRLVRQNAALRGPQTGHAPPRGPIHGPGRAQMHMANAMSRVGSGTGGLLAGPMGVGHLASPAELRGMMSPGVMTGNEGRIMAAGRPARQAAAAAAGQPRPTNAASMGRHAQMTGGRPPTTGAAATPAAAKLFGDPKNFRQWATSTRNPIEVYRQTAEGAFGKAGRMTAAGQKPGMFTRGISTRLGAKSMGMLASAGPALTVSFVGDILGVNEAFEQGTTADRMTEGALVGASFGALGGVPGAFVGGAIGGALNTITGGALVDFAQKIPLVGGMFGSEEVFDVLGQVETMFTNSANAAGLDPAMAKSAATLYAGYHEMIQNGILPEGSEMMYMQQAAREAGFTGYPWEPEALTPVYSPEDLAEITRVIGDDLRPMYDVAIGLLQQDFREITDEKVRRELLEGSQKTAENIMASLGASMQGPAAAAILSESTRNATNSNMAGQLPDEFAGLLANA